MHMEDEYVLQAVRAGASGYLVKDSDTSELLAALRSLHAGRGYFSPRAARTIAEQLQHPERTLDDPYGRLTTPDSERFHLMDEGPTTQERARPPGTNVKPPPKHTN